MNKDVFVGVVAVDEAVAVADVKPLDGAGDGGFDHLFWGGGFWGVVVGVGGGGF